MTTLPIASFCSADAAPSKSSQSCADKQAETGEPFHSLQHYKPHHGISLPGEVVTPARISDEISSSGEENLPLPVGPVTPKERLPHILNVYDKDTFRRISVRGNDAAWDSMEKILARGPIKFVRKYPVRIPRCLQVKVYSSLHLHTACFVHRNCPRRVGSPGYLEPPHNRPARSQAKAKSRQR
jgi:hypothetical protein